MPIRTGQQFLEALNDDRRIFMDGEEIGDIAHDPRTAGAAPEFGKSDKRFADHIRDYHVHARERDLCMTHTLLNPQVDRSRPVERQEKDLAAKIVKETDAGMVLKGARMVSTLCAYSDDLLVLPSTFLATNADAAPYAFAFSIPVAAPGLRFICRPSVVHQNAASVMDYPLSSP